MQEFAYHGVGENLLAFGSIMQHGIVSRDYAYRNNISTYTQNAEYSYNGESFISVAIPHTEERGALSRYIFNGGISLKTKPLSIELPRVIGTFFDEGFVSDCINLEQIDGIIVTNSLRKKKISELQPIVFDAPKDFSGIAFHILYQLEDEIELSPEQTTLFQDLINLYNTCLSTNNFDKCDNIKEQINIFLSAAMERFFQKKLGKEDISVLDVVEYYNQGKFPIYDENDLRIQCRGKSVPQSFYEHSLKHAQQSFYQTQEKYSPKIYQQIYQPNTRVENPNSPFKVSHKKTKLYDFLKNKVKSKGVTLADCIAARTRNNLPKRRYGRNNSTRER